MESFLLVPGAASAADPEWPWRFDHWPQQQPWQEDAPPSALRFGGGEAPQAKRESGSRLGHITLTATSESDPTKSDTASCVAISR